MKDLYVPLHILHESYCWTFPAFMKENKTTFKLAVEIQDAGSIDVRERTYSSVVGL